MTDPATTSAGHSPSTGQVLARVARDRTSVLAFAILTVAAAAIYATVLPAEQAGGRLSPANWVYLDSSMLVFSLLLAGGLAAVLTLQVYALRQALLTRRATGGHATASGFGFVVSLVPSLCCTPVLPAVLALFGIGASGAASTMRLIAPHRTLILLAILGLFIILGWWSTRRIAGHIGTSAASHDCC